MNSIRGKLGLPNVKKPFTDFFTFPSLVMQLSTPAFEYPRSDLPDNVKFTGPILLDPTRDYNRPTWWNDLSTDHIVVLVNQGTIAKNFDDLIIPTIRGLAEEEVLVVIVPVASNEIEGLPSNVRAEKFIPFDQILPYVDVMVTNGGYGGTQMALAHGIPLVLAGATDDKMEVSARVEWANAGINLRKSKPSPNEIKNAVKEVLTNPQFKASAERIQKDFQKYDAPKIASELLESLVPR
jgi:UDP:flavonoid glycosyltransferase YjiC (YdhE family)